MANEAVIIELLGNGGEPVRFTVGNNAAIEKGTLMRLYDPRTVSGATGTGVTFAGIAAAEKVAGDGSTSMALYTYGIFDLTLATNSTCQAGDMVIVSGTNLIARASDYAPGGLLQSGAWMALQSGMVIGKALETGASAEVIAVKVDC